MIFVQILQETINKVTITSSPELILPGEWWTPVTRRGQVTVTYYSKTIVTTFHKISSATRLLQFLLSNELRRERHGLDTLLMKLMIQTL